MNMPTLTKWSSLLLCLMVTFGCATTGLGNESDAPKPPPGGNFTLHSKDGPISLSDFKGKVVLLFFGYTSCPDVCPTSLAFSAKALNSLDKTELEQVQPLFITLDPQRDTAEKLDKYVKFFHPKLAGLTGSEEEIARTAKLYGVKHYRVESGHSSSDYDINHSAALYLITKGGTLRFLFPHGTSPALVAKAIRYLLTIPE